MLQVLQITASYKPAFIYGGPTISVSKLAECLNKTGKIEVTVLTTTANGQEDFEYKNGEIVWVDGVKTIYYRRITGDHSHFSPKLLCFLFNNVSKYDIIHIQAWWNLVSMLSAFICILRGVKYVISPRGTLSNYTIKKTGSSKKYFHRYIGKKWLKSAYYLLSSEKEKQDIQSFADSFSYSIIPNLINLPDSNIVNHQDKADTEVFKLLFFSRIERKKGLEFLLEAMKDIPKNCILYLYGEGETEYVNRLKKDYSGLGNKVCWMGSLYGEDKFRVLKQNDLLILPSYDENFANVVIESLSVGTAVLLTKSVGVSNYVIENKFGWLCNQDVEDIAIKIKLITNSQEELTRIRLNSPSKVISDFSEATLIEKYLDVYKMLTKKNN